METTPRPPVKWLEAYALHALEASGCKSLLVTGARGRGKTTLIQALVADRALPGIRSILERDSLGQPRRVVLESRLGHGRCVIGQRTDDGPMLPLPQALEAAGVAMLEEARCHHSPWVVVDEIGFLEEAAPLYRQALLTLFDSKRVIAALRKADMPFLTLLARRADCLLLDLDTLEEPL